MRILIHSCKDWTYANIAPALEGHEVTRCCYDNGSIPDIYDFDVVIVTEPHIHYWFNYYETIAGDPRHILGMQHGVTFYEEANPNGFWKFNKYLVWGEMGKTSVINGGLSEDRVIITGNPRMDQYFNLPTSNDGTIVIIGGDHGSDLRMYTPYIEELQKIGPVIHSLHPGVVINKDTWPGVKTVCGGATQLMQKALCVIHSDSTCGVEAMIMKKPVVSVRHFYPQRFSNGHYVAAKGYVNVDHMVTEVKKQIEDMSDHSDFIKWVVGDGKATAKMRQFIEEFASSIKGEQ